MKILFLTWKDPKHPYAWWAEKVMYEYAKWLQKLWHEVTWFWYKFNNSKEIEIIDWINIIRKFKLYNSYFLFPKYYKKYLAWKYDVIIDEAWGLPFLSLKFEKKIPIIFFTHHIWDKEWDTSFPFPLNQIWKQVYYWLFKQYKNTKTITVSDSTKNELIEKFGFKWENIKVIENACDIIPISNIEFQKKENKILFLWRLMPIKRVEDAIYAFNEFLKSDLKNSDYTLDIVWNDQDKKYVDKLKNIVIQLWINDKVNFQWHIERSKFKDFISTHKAILVPSMKEWFGLIVLEANSYGLPAIWYDVAWVRDSIKNWVNWYLVEFANYKNMWKKLNNLINDFYLYENMSIKALEYVKTLKSWSEKTKEFEEFIFNK